jgi:transcriptional regulator with XRE-family HTH domain
VAQTHQPTPTSLRMRIAEKRVRQHRVAARIDMSASHLSHILTGRVATDQTTLARIAEAIEDVAGQIG